MSKMTIWVLDNHWCIIGVLVKETDESIKVSDAMVIRRWGTNEGLGQLAIEGIRPETILDRQPPTTIYKNQITFSMECAEIWTPEYIAAHYVAEALNE